MPVLFTARMRFSPTCGRRWRKWYRWARIPQLKEVVTLDTMLCPSPFIDLLDEDWNHNIHQDLRVSYFTNPEYVIGRVAHELNSFNVLAVVFEPCSDPSSVVVDDRFVFCGYDLLDPEGDISAVTNCGGFDDALTTSDISSVGLLPDYAFAREVQQRLVSHYPEAFACECRMCAVWRYQPG